MPFGPGYPSQNLSLEELIKIIETLIPKPQEGASFSKFGAPNPSGQVGQSFGNTPAPMPMSPVPQNNLQVAPNFPMQQPNMNAPTLPQGMSAGVPMQGAQKPFVGKTMSP